VSVEDYGNRVRRLEGGPRKCLTHRMCYYYSPILVVFGRGWQGETLMLPLTPLIHSWLLGILW
jgi:hypothetical protein